MREVVTVITIGDELVQGMVEDTNYDFIRGRLEELGISPLAHLVVVDKLGPITELLRAAMLFSRAIIITGGLGPTSDDLTREAVAEALGRKLIYDPSLGEWLRERFASYGREMPLSNLRQAQVIEGAKIIAPTKGTAPGQELDERGVKIFLVPGVPSEMRDMMERQVLPSLSKWNEQGKALALTIKFFGLTEAAVGEAMDEIVSPLQGAKVSYLVKSGVIEARLFLEGGIENYLEDRMRKLVNVIEERLRPWIVSTDGKDLQEVVGDLLRENKCTLAVAESCTGGMLGEIITEIPGSSDYFRGGVICYDQTVKTRTLGVDERLISEKGVVSEEVAMEMAKAVRELLGADIGLAITGWAGPGGGTAESPPGTVCLALHAQEGSHSLKVRLPGDREMVRKIASNAALALLKAFLKGETSWIR